MKNNIGRIVILIAFIIGLLFNMNLSHRKITQKVLFNKIALIMEANANSESPCPPEYLYLALRYCGSDMTWACIKTTTAAYCNDSAECCKDS